MAEKIRLTKTGITAPMYCELAAVDYWVNERGWVIDPSDQTPPPPGSQPVTHDELAAFGLAAAVRMIDDPNFRQIPVVMMHEFATGTGALGVLKDYVSWGYQGIFVSELYEYLRTGDASGLPKKPIVLTDDDGGQSSYTNLFPQLQALGLKCTYYLVPDWIDGTITAPANGGTFMEASPITWANAVEMQASGLVEFQAHTKAHGSMRLLSGAGQFTGAGEGAGADFLYCKQRIEQMIPGSVVWYNAAPYGVINETAIQSLKDAGCKGNRITGTGTDFDGVYDGSGSFAFTLPSTDPFRVPIADPGNMKYLRKANVFGEADADGNQFQNGRFRVTSRGVTLPSGWTLTTATTLPQSAGTGPVLRGFGTAAATGAYHTDKIPVGVYSQFNMDWWVQCTNAPAASCRLVVDCFAGKDDTTPVRTYTEASPVGGTTGWTRKRYYFTGEGDFAWIRPRFEIVGATSSSEMLVWDVKLRRPRTLFPFPAGGAGPKPADVWIAPADFQSSTGAPTLGRAGSRFPAWQLDAAVAEQVNASIVVPPSMPQFHVDLVWTNQAAGAGDVVWQVIYSTRSDGDLLSAGDVTLGPTTITAPPLDVQKVSTLTSTPIVPAAGSVYHFRVQRAAADVADTLGNDVCLLGIRLRAA